MKEFLKYVGATMVGIIALGIVMSIFGLSMLLSMAFSSDTAVEVKNNSVMVMQLSGPVEERSQDDPMAMIMGNGTESLGLEQMMEAIDKAKNNDNIKGIYLEAGAVAFDAPATAQALREKLNEFRQSGKWIVAYGETYTQMAYYVCSVADEVYVNPKGMLDWHGMASQPIFFKDVLAKFGVKFQLVKVGKYKSAPEMMTADKMSEPNREQVTAYTTGIWNEFLDDVEESRQINRDSLNSYADRPMLFEEAEEYVALNFVDSLLYTDEVKTVIKARLGIEADDDINTLSLSDMANIEDNDDNADDRVAIYYAYGDVVDTTPAGVDSNPCIAGDKVSKDLEDLADDDDVKAVVLRMNSGGGSAYASEQIWHAMMKLKEKKPVVVSMGGYAASGGYYISCPANYIFAEPTTITGSIGIFGMFPDMSELLTEKLGVKFDIVKTNEHADFGTMARPFNAEELTILDGYIGRGYELFRQRVADGRGMTTDQVEAIAQGRVWLATDALNINLVDELGGLDKAVAKAAELAELKEYGTDAYPAQPDFLTQLLEQAIGGDSYIDAEMKSALGEYYKPFMMLKTMNKQNAIQARMPYHLVIE